MTWNRQSYTASEAGILSCKVFSLIEVVVVMSIFIGIIIITSQTFNNILTLSTKQVTSAESDTHGVIGLEILRLDMEQAGYGLPWIMNFAAEFAEATVAANSLAPGIATQDFNDMNNGSSDTNKVPRAVQASVSTTDGRDYLVIKSTLAGMNDAVKKWAYADGVGAASRLKVWPDNNFAGGERVVTIDSRTKRLIGTSTASDDFSYEVTSTNMMPPANFQPAQDTDVFVVYAVSSGTNLRAPYNRVDYYVKRPTTGMSTRCAPGTGNLYKALMMHTDGTFTEYPLVECVADMQVVFMLAPDADGRLVATDHSGLSALSSKQIRQQLKEIRVYIVTHEGARDSMFTYPSEAITVGEGNGRDLNLKTGVVLTDAYKNYRWKVFKLTATPRNINY